MKKTLLRICLTLALITAISGCNLPGAATDTSLPTSAAATQDDASVVRTAAAKTVEVIKTQAASKFTATPEPSATLEATAADATATPGADGATATAAPESPTATVAVPATATSVGKPCDRATFVSESVKDGTNFGAGEVFTKEWTLQNAGSCAWTSNYKLVFSTGEAMGAAAVTDFVAAGASIAPGQSVTISLKLTAPVKAGKFKGEWLLRNDKNGLFGVGDQGNKTFWVDIVVASTTFNFIENMCKARWTSAAGTLACPGASGDAKGFVLKVDNPKLENGQVDDEPALQLTPQQVTDGYIQGEFPALKITDGSHFKTILGCKFDSKNCNVKFVLSYKPEGGAETKLNEWTETNDGGFTKIDIELNTLGGQNVTFILKVTTNGAFNQDDVFLLLPRIE